MADKAAETKTEVPVKETEKDKKEEVEETKPENGDKVEENGESEEKKSENGDDTEKKDKKDVEEKCSVKRKSGGGGGDATDGTPAEEASPEKKPKLKEAPAEVESKEKVKAAA